MAATKFTRDRCVFLLISAVAATIALVAAVELQELRAQHQLTTSLIARFDSSNAYWSTQNSTPAWVEMLLGEIRYFDRITELGVDGEPLTAADLRLINTQSHLRVLGITNAEVDDQDLRLLDGIMMVEHLDLTGNTVTSDAVPLLNRYPELRSVGLSGTGFSEPDVARLRSMKPDMEVHW